MTNFKTDREKLDAISLLNSELFSLGKNQLQEIYSIAFQIDSICDVPLD